VGVELLVFLCSPNLVCLNYSSNSQTRKECRVDSVLDSIVDMAASSDSSSTRDSINDAIILAGLPNLAANTLRLAVLGQGGSSCEVAKTIDALELLVAVGGRFEVLNEGSRRLDALTIGY
jgi:hypothetical protein